MNQVYYRLPIRLGTLMASQELPTCGVGVSIAQVLYLLLHSQYGELRSDRSFGCKIWDIEFDRTISHSRWVDHLSESMVAAIQQHETRLRNPEVTVQFLPVEHRIEPLPEEFRRLVIVTINAILRETEEPFRFSTQLHLGQLSAQ